MEAAFSLGMPKDRLWGMTLAVAVHGLVFGLGALGLMHKAEYGMDASRTDVELIAAPAFSSSPQTASSVFREIKSAPDDVIEPQKTPVTTPPPQPLQTTEAHKPLGDGHSAMPGQEATANVGVGQGGTTAKPGYFRNPPPPYPAEARRLKQQGRVVLEVLVNTQGDVAEVLLKQSSGLPLLDQAALQGVQKWRFRPANAAGVRVEARVEIPIRFELK